MAQVGASIDLEFYWQGMYVYNKKWKISNLEVKIVVEKVTHKLFASINTNLPPEQKQQLTLRIKNSHPSKVHGHEHEHEPFYQLESSISGIKSMEISATLSHVDSKHTRRHTHMIPVFVGLCPKIQASKTYHIIITYQYGELQASIKKMRAESTEADNPPFQAHIIKAYQRLAAISTASMNRPKAISSPTSTAQMCATS